MRAEGDAVFSNKRFRRAVRGGRRRARIIVAKAAHRLAARREDEGALVRREIREARADAPGAPGAREGRRAHCGFGWDRGAERQTKSYDSLNGGVAGSTSFDNILEPNDNRTNTKPVVVERGPRPRMTPHVRVPARGLAAAARPLVGPRREEVPHALDGVEGAPRHDDGGGDTAMPSSPFRPVGLDAPAVDAALAPQSVPAEPKDQRPYKRAVRARAEARALLEQESH